MVDQLITSPTLEESTDRAWLLGKMQTSLMRDGWAVVDIDPENGTLGIADGRLSFTVSVSVPAREWPTGTKFPAKKSAVKRKR